MWRSGYWLKLLPVGGAKIEAIAQIFGADGTFLQRQQNDKRKFQTIADWCLKPTAINLYFDNLISNFCQHLIFDLEALGLE